MTTVVQCGACLSLGRRVTPLGTTRAAHAARALGEEVGAELQVCWECRALVDKSLLFCLRVRSTQSFLTSQNDQKHTAFSTLDSRTKIDFDFELTYDENDLADRSHASQKDTEPNSSEWEIPLLTSFKIELQEYPESTLEVFDQKMYSEAPGSPEEYGHPNTSYNFSSGETPRSKETAAAVDGVISTVLSESERLKILEEDRKSEQYVKSLFKCDTCLKGFLSAVFLEEHNTKNHDLCTIPVALLTPIERDYSVMELGPHACDICAVRFPTKGKLHVHRLKHYQLYECSRCEYAQRNHTLVKRHYIDVHEADKMHPCKKCDQVFATYKEFRSHQINVHLKKRTCPHCHRVFNSKTYNAHVKSHSENRGLPMLECAVCQKVLRGKNSLKSHMKTHAPRAGFRADAFCAECNQQFKDKYIYQQHLTHSTKHISFEQMKHPCDKCDKRFVTARELRNHHVVVHLKELIKCDQCDKTYMTAYGLKLHVRKVHEGVRPPKDMICDICEMAFRTKLIMETHRRTHTGEKPFKCTQCDASFRQSGALRTHARLIHAPKEGQ